MSRDDVRGHFPYDSYPHPTDHEHPMTAPTPRMVDEHNAAVGERRGDGVLVGGPVGLHVCPACGLQHELPAKKREPLPWTAVAYDEGDESP